MDGLFGVPGLCSSSHPASVASSLDFGGLSIASPNSIAQLSLNSIQALAEAESALDSGVCLCVCPSGFFHDL